MKETIAQGYDRYWKYGFEVGFKQGMAVGAALINWAQAVRNNYRYNPSDFCAGCRVIWADAESRHDEECMWRPST